MSLITKATQIFIYYVIEEIVITFNVMLVCKIFIIKR